MKVKDLKDLIKNLDDDSELLFSCIHNIYRLFSLYDYYGICYANENGEGKLTYFIKIEEIK